MAKNGQQKKYLSRDEVLNAPDIKVEDVEVPEWGGAVRVKTLTGTERDWYEASLWQGKGTNRVLNLKMARAKLAALSLVDERGARIFSEQDIEALTKKSAAALDRVFGVSQRLSRISDEDIENLLKSSEEMPAADSPSA